MVRTLYINWGYIFSLRHISNDVTAGLHKVFELSRIFCVKCCNTRKGRISRINDKNLRDMSQITGILPKTTLLIDPFKILDTVAREMTQNPTLIPEISLIKTCTTINHVPIIPSRAVTNPKQTICLQNIVSITKINTLFDNHFWTMLQQNIFTLAKFYRAINNNFALIVNRIISILKTISLTPSASHLGQDATCYAQRNPSRRGFQLHLTLRDKSPGRIR